MIQSNQIEMRKVKVIKTKWQSKKPFKGVRKIPWYCTLCKKQCKTANGFRCHQNSKSHQQFLSPYQLNPSKAYEQCFLKIMKERYYINQRVHVDNHFRYYVGNRIQIRRTKWKSLNQFFSYMKQTSTRMILEETENGWFITYVNG